ncbi:MAG: peptide deformylase [Clostridia bacterium]|nr:peptide deformylase [Clostridia bacterium]
MIRPIMRDPLFLSQKSMPADKADAQVLTDLMDTLRANQERCVGMAANMIGVRKRIIAFFAGPFCIGMYNPEIVKKSGPYETSEGCLSLDGERRTTRYLTIEVSYLDHQFKPQKMTYTGWVAQIIQHEIDHCDGILI